MKAGEVSGSHQLTAEAGIAHRAVSAQLAGMAAAQVIAPQNWRMQQCLQCRMKPSIYDTSRLVVGPGQACLINYIVGSTIPSTAE